MADKYSTIQQHQPLRVPQSFDKQGKALVVQLDEVFDDIYRRFGRLKVSDLGSELKGLCLVKDENGKYISVQTTIDGIQIDIQEQLDGKISKTSQYQDAESIVTAAELYTDGYAIAKTSTYQDVASIISAAESYTDGHAIAKTSVYQDAASIVSTAEGYTDGLLVNYSTSTQVADAISLAVSNCYGKVSLIDIKTTGIEVKSSGSIKLLASDSSSKVELDKDGIDIYTGSILNIFAGGSIRIKNSTDAANLIKLDKNGLYLYTGGILDITGGSLEIGSGTTMTLWSGGAFNINSGSSFAVAAGGAINFLNNGGNNVMSFDLNGIEIGSNKHIKLTSGNTYVEITPSMIDMNTAGYVRILGHGNSVISLEGSSQTIFRADSSGVVQAVSIMSSDITTDTLTVNNLTVSGNIIADIDIPNIVVSDTQPSGHGIIWLEPNTSMITPFNESRSIANGTQQGWSGGSNYTWTQTCSLSSSINGEGATRVKISGSLRKSGNTAADATELYAKLVLSDNTQVDLGKVGNFPANQSLNWNYGFSKEVNITAIAAGLNITDIVYTYKVTNSTQDSMAYYSIPHSATLQVSGERGTAGSSDECTVHYIA